MHKGPYEQKYILLMIKKSHFFQVLLLRVDYARICQALYPLYFSADSFLYFQMISILSEEIF